MTSALDLQISFLSVSIHFAKKYPLNWKGLRICSNNPNLDHFSGIIPCGNENSGVTSIEKIGLDISKKEIDNILISNFSKVFKIDVKLTQTLS